MLSPFTKLALLQDSVTPKGAPGPARPANPNGIKAISLGQSSFLNPPEGEEGVDPADMDKANKATSNAEQASQAAKHQAEQAQHQMKLQQQELKHHQAMAGMGNHASNSYFNKKFTTVLGAVNKLNSSSRMLGIQHGLSGLKSATTQDLKTRSGAAWPTNQPAPPAGGSPLVDIRPSMARQGIDYDTMAAGGYHIPAGETAGGTAWRGLKDPASMLPVAKSWAGHVPYLRGLVGDQYVEPIGKPGAKPGTLGSAVAPLATGANWLLNAPRTLGNAAVNVATNAMGAVSHLGQAAYQAPGAVKELGSAVQQHGFWDTPMGELPKLQATLGHLGSGAMDTAQTAMSVVPWGRGAGLGAKAMGTMWPAIEDPIANLSKSHAAAEASKQQEALRAAAVKASLPGSQPAGSAEWLTGLMSKFGPYLKGLVSSPQAPVGRITDAGAAGHQVRNANQFNPFKQASTTPDVLKGLAQHPSPHMQANYGWGTNLVPKMTDSPFADAMLRFGRAALMPGPQAKPFEASSYRTPNLINRMGGSYRAGGENYAQALGNVPAFQRLAELQRPGLLNAIQQSDYSQYAQPLNETLQDPRMLQALPGLENVKSYL